VLPLADLHVHLLAGLDDGPRTSADALEMCRMASAEGTRLAASLAHQNECWPDVTPERIRAGVHDLSASLTAAGIELEVFPCGEVMARSDLAEAFRAGKLMSVADRGEFLLVEMPHGLFVDLRPAVEELQSLGIRLILAHPERTPELLHDPGTIEELIALGCLVQVSAGSITELDDGRTERVLRDWIKRGVVHLLGSDGHSPRRRPPRLAAAVERIRQWTDDATADRIGSTLGRLVLRGQPVRVPLPRPPARRWWARMW
jgi:protein-tyrosine phosphatase